MKIVNIDAPEHLVEKVLHLRIQDFILDVIRPLERKYNKDLSECQIKYGFQINHYKNIKIPPFSSIWKFQEEGYENIAVLLHTIPIYLCDSGPIVNREVCDESTSIRSIIDLLGAYHSNLNGGSPYIELYLSKIYDSVKCGTLFKWLFTKVLIHELAHAALDIFNEEDGDYIEKVTYSSDFGRWREESMANAVALRIIKEYGNKRFYYFVKDFMLSQDPEYALGVLMEDFEEMDFKNVFDSKLLGVDKDLQQEWLNYVKGSPDWKGLHKWNELFDQENVFYCEGKYYTDEGDLVCDIINKVLLDYENENGEKMSCNTFSSIFPQKMSNGELLYDFSSKEKKDSFHSIKFELKDDEISLYCYHDINEVRELIKKLNIYLKEYNNY